MCNKVTIYILFIALSSLLLGACKSDGAFSTLSLNDGNENIPGVEVKPEIHLPKLSLESIRILVSDSQEPELKAFTHDGNVIDMSRLSHITWSIDDESIATLDVSNSQTMLTGVQKGTTQLHVSAEVDGAVISTQANVIVHGNHVVTWGSSEYGARKASEGINLINVKSLSANAYVFAAAKLDGTVVTQGRNDYGGYAPSDLKDVVDIYPKQLDPVSLINLTMNTSFAAVKSDGHVVSWGGRTLSIDTAACVVDFRCVDFGETFDVQKIYSNVNSFTALNSDGRIFTWNPVSIYWMNAQGNSELNDIKSDINSIVTTESVFAGIKQEGKVVTWVGGSYSFGEFDISNFTDQLVGVTSLVAAETAFAALKQDESVVSWGADGELYMEGQELVDVRNIYSTFDAFAALKNDGTVVTWGDTKYSICERPSYCGSDSALVQSELDQVKDISATLGAFAALKEDGTVIAWGDSNYGGNISLVKSELVDVVKIVANSTAFAALKNDGTVVTWGGETGGDSGSVYSELVNVKDIIPANLMFSALRKDGSVVLWGKSSFSGSSFGETLLQQLPPDYSGEIIATAGAFAAIIEDD